MKLRNYPNTFAKLVIAYLHQVLVGVGEEA
jgi:hypothetical protein